MVAYLSKNEKKNFLIFWKERKQLVTPPKKWDIQHTKHKLLQNKICFLIVAAAVGHKLEIIVQPGLHFHCSTCSEISHMALSDSECSRSGWRSCLSSSQLKASTDQRNISLFGHKTRLVFEAMHAEWLQRIWEGGREVRGVWGVRGWGLYQSRRQQSWRSQLCNTTNVRPSHKLRPSPASLLLDAIFSIHQLK